MRALFVESKVEKFPKPVLGMVEQTITLYQPGRVRCRGTSWPARFYQPDCQATAHPEHPVTVVAIEGITLLVMPVANS